MKNESIITIKEARKLLGQEASKLSNDAIEKIINELDFLATLAIQRIGAINENDPATKNDRNRG